MRLALSFAFVATVLAASPGAAQARGRTADSIPEGHKPPAGMCRIWLPNVPPGKQAAPTDCQTAVRNRPANATVIFGDPAPDKSNPREKANPQRDKAPIPLPLAPTQKGKGKKTAPATPPVIPPPPRDR